MTFPTLTDVYAARERICRHRPADAADAPCAAQSGNGPRSVGQARESQPDQRLQGPRRPEPRAVAVAGRTPRAASSRRAPAITASRSRSRVSGKACRARCSCPTATIPDKNAAMRAYRRDRRRRRPRLRRSARALRACAAPTRGARYVHSANEPLLIAGVATYALEIFEQLPEVDTIFVPVGGGSGACGNCLVRTRARRVRAGHRRPGRASRRLHALVPLRHARRRRFGRRRSRRAWRRASPSTCTFAFLARELDDIVMLSEERACRGRPSGAADDAQPRRRRRRRRRSPRR